MSSKEEVSHESEEEEVTNQSGESDDYEGGSDTSSAVNINLTDNKIYQALCTLFEDEDGNNILDYVSMLHTELITIGKNLESVKPIQSDIHRIAVALETLVKAQGLKPVEEKSSSEKPSKSHSSSKRSKE